MANPVLLHLPLRSDLVGRDRNGIVTATANGPVRFTADGYYAEEATTNYALNPRGAVDATNWSAGADRTVTRVTSLPTTENLPSGVTTAFRADATVDKVGNYSMGDHVNITLAGAGAHTLSGYVYIPSSWTGGLIRLDLLGFTGATGTLFVDADDDVRDTWQRLIVPAFTVDAGDLLGSFRVVSQSSWTAGEYVLFTAFQLEAKAYATSYCDGSLGTGYSWAGTAHASASSRAGSYFDVMKPAGLLPSSMAVALRLVPKSPGSSTQVVFFTGNYGFAGRDFLAIYLDPATRRAYGLTKSGTQAEDTSVSVYALPYDQSTMVLTNWGTTTFQSFSGAVAGPVTNRDLPVLNDLGTAAMRFGSFGASNFVNSSISDVMVFDRPLTESERNLLSATPEWSFGVLADRIKPGLLLPV